MDTNFYHLGQILTNAYTRFANEKAIVGGGKDYTFGEVANATNMVRRKLLDFNVQPKQKVALLLPNCPAFSVYYFGALWSGLIVVPINPLLSQEEISFLVKDSESVLLVSWEGMREEAQEVCDAIDECQFLVSMLDPIANLCVKAGDEANHELEQQSIANECLEDLLPFCPDSHDETAVILYTSGTTGVPKGAELTHGNLLHNAIYVSEKKFSCEGRANLLAPGDVGLAVLPLSHVFGQTNLQNGCWIHGAAISYARRFCAQEVIEQLERDRITFLPGVPTMFFEMVEAMRAFSKPIETCLKYCVCGGAAIDAKVKTEFESLFGVAVQESYGLTETSPMTSFQRINQTQKCGSVGKPLDDVTVKIVDEHGAEMPSGERGELAVRGPNVFKGYFNRSSETQNVFFDGWLRTGDIAVIDSDGDINIVDRKKEMIIRGGYKVYPREVETILVQLPFVREAAVIGVADERLGEEVKAVISLRKKFGQKLQCSELESSAGDNSIVQAVKTYCKEKLAAYKWPRIVEIIEELPKGSTGKISKKLLHRNAMQDPLQPNCKH